MDNNNNAACSMKDYVQMTLFFANLVVSSGYDFFSFSKPQLHGERHFIKLLALILNALIAMAQSGP